MTAQASHPIAARHSGSQRPYRVDNIRHSGPLEPAPNLGRERSFGRCRGRSQRLGPSAHQPRRITIDEAVDGLAHPRLALTSTSLTWRQPPSL